MFCPGKAISVESSPLHSSHKSIIFRDHATNMGNAPISTQDSNADRHLADIELCKGKLFLASKAVTTGDKDPNPNHRVSALALQILLILGFCLLVLVQKQITIQLLCFNLVAP